MYGYQRRCKRTTCAAKMLHQYFSPLTSIQSFFNLSPTGYSNKTMNNTPNPIVRASYNLLCWDTPNIGEEWCAWQEEFHTWPCNSNTAHSIYSSEWQPSRIVLYIVGAHFNIVNTGYVYLLINLIRSLFIQGK